MIKIVKLVRYATRKILQNGLKLKDVDTAFVKTATKSI